MPANDIFSPGPSNRIISSWPMYVKTTQGNEIAVASHKSMDSRSKIICNDALAISITVMSIATVVRVPLLKPSM